MKTIKIMLVTLALSLILGGCQTHAQLKQHVQQQKSKKSYVKKRPRINRPKLKNPNIEYIECDFKRKTIEVSLESGYGIFAACEEYQVVRIGYVSSGRPSTHRTPRGTYSVQWKAKEYDSKKYPSSPGQPNNMDNAMFFHKGFAMHKGNINGNSHGCVRTQKYQSEWLYDWAPHGTRIIVQDL